MPRWLPFKPFWESRHRKSHFPHRITVTGVKVISIWDYIDSSGAVIPLTLDEQGKGHYEWKKGHFETRRLVDHTWSGKWVQKENDREGGFRVKFSPDFSEGDGQWWYSRIGNDKAPTLKGGAFQLRARSKNTHQHSIAKQGL